MAARQRRRRRELLARSVLTAGLGMLAGGTAAHAQTLPPVPDSPVAVTVPTTLPSDTTVSPVAPTVPPLTVLGPDPGGLVPNPLAPVAGGTAPAPGGGASSGTSTPGQATGPGYPAEGSPAGGGGPEVAPAAGSSVRSDEGAGRGIRAADDRPARDAGTLRRLAVESAVDFSVPFLLGGLALAYLFFQRRMYADDPALAAAAGEDDELLRFT